MDGWLSYAYSEEQDKEKKAVSFDAGSHQSDPATQIELSGNEKTTRLPTEENGNMTQSQMNLGVSYENQLQTLEWQTDEYGHSEQLEIGSKLATEPLL